MYSRRPGQPLKFKNKEELIGKIDKYFADCEKKKVPLTITGLALALDTSRRTLINYEKKKKYFHTIKNAKLMCEHYAEEYLYNGKNVAGAIFNLKNNYGWVDKQEFKHTGKVFITNLIKEATNGNNEPANKESSGKDKE